MIRLFPEGLGFVRRAEFERITGKLLTDKGDSIMADVEGLKVQVSEIEDSMGRMIEALKAMRTAVADLTEQLKLCGAASVAAVAEAIERLKAADAKAEEALAPSGGGASMGGIES